MSDGRGAKWRADGLRWIDAFLTAASEGEPSAAVLHLAARYAAAYAAFLADPVDNNERLNGAWAEFNGNCPPGVREHFEAMGSPYDVRPPGWRK